jgi:O-antigen/teichoic acid export membrane protein
MRLSAKRPRSLRNILSNWGAFAFSVVVNLFLTPFIVSSLGDAQYGVWVLLASIVGYMGLLDLGIRSAVMRHVARFHARGEDAVASEYASTGLAIFGTLGFVAIVLSAIVSALLPTVFNLDDKFVAEARQVLVIGGFTVALSLVGGVYAGVVSAMQRFDLRSSWQVVVGALRAIAIMLALRAGYDLLALAVIQCGATVVSLTGEVAMCRRLYPELRVGPGHVQTQLVRPIFSFATNSSVLHVSRSIIISANTLVIGIFLPVDRITYYSLATSLLFYTRSVIASIAQTVTPQASAVQAIGEPGEMGALFLRMARLASLVVAPIAVTFLVRGETFLDLWMGDEYGEVSGPLLRILAASLVVTAPGQVLMSTLIGVKEHHRLIPFQLSEAGLNVLLSVLLVVPFELVGVAWSNTLPTIFLSFAALVTLGGGTLGVGRGAIMTAVFLRPWCSMIPFAAVSYLLDTRWPVDNLAFYFGQVLLALPVAASGAYAFSTLPRERAAIRDRIRMALLALAP